LEPGEHEIIETGVHLQLPIGYEAQIRSRSGLAGKHAVIVLNAPGTVDETYTGEVKVILINHGKESHEIKKGDRIAQMVIKKVYETQLEEMEVMPTNESRGDAGFGSTGR
jgi:dUTP pyrophosphatase